MSGSEFKPPIICRSCEDCARCDFIRWPFADPGGLTCPVFVPAEA